jgi:hypothetical protein
MLVGIGVCVQDLDFSTQTLTRSKEYLQLRRGLRADDRRRLVPGGLHRRALHGDADCLALYALYGGRQRALLHDAKRVSVLYLRLRPRDAPKAV